MSEYDQRARGKHTRTVQDDPPDVRAQVDAPARSYGGRVREEPHHHPCTVRPPREHDPARPVAPRERNLLAPHKIHERIVQLPRLLAQQRVDALCERGAVGGREAREAVELGGAVRRRAGVAAPAERDDARVVLRGEGEELLEHGCSQSQERM